MNLSGGMKQKILVAMAMAAEAQLLFLDEPTIGLDPVSRRQVWSAINEWKSKGQSILLTTHYMDEAEMLSDLYCHSRQWQDDCPGHYPGTAQGYSAEYPRRHFCRRDGSGIPQETMALSLTPAPEC